ncbi:MAG: hypothetical protein EAZ52_08095 [Alphaproteobacteria bacterium]|nr:MAG: hypothetical protein EAZ52_08095 [Alphaproteobacteria bacterium]
MELNVGGWLKWWSDHYGCRGILLKNENCSAGNEHWFRYSQVMNRRNMRATAMMSRICQFAIILLFILMIILRLFNHLAVITFTIHT